MSDKADLLFAIAVGGLLGNLFVALLVLMALLAEALL